MALEKVDGARPYGEHRVAFVFSERMTYPPDIHDMKVYYLTKEMQKRGVNVNWVQIGGKEKKWSSDGIRFAVLGTSRGALLPEALLLLRLFYYCAVGRIKIVYEDEWLFLRNRPMARLVGQMILRVLGVKLVLDQRDPFPDFEVAAGFLVEGTRRYWRMSIMRSLLLRQTDLIILPSEAYSNLYESEGISKKKVLGTFRGIDPELFELKSDPNNTRTRLGLENDFVIGWFGLMHSYRMIKEIIIPLIEKSPKEMPNAHFLIGGEGPLLDEFERLRNSEARNSFTLLGKIPYSMLPDYIAACNVTICPVSTEFRFSTHSNWLKIAESLAVGIPVVATRTEISKLDYGNMKGVTWVEPNYGAFLNALKGLGEDPESFRLEAEEQAKHFDAYSIESTIPKIVNRVLALVKTS